MPLTCSMVVTSATATTPRLHQYSKEIGCCFEGSQTCKKPEALHHWHVWERNGPVATQLQRSALTGPMYQRAECLKTATFRPTRRMDSSSQASRYQKRFKRSMPSLSSIRS